MVLEAVARKLECMNLTAIEGKAMPDEHEVLHMSKRMRLDGEVYDREVSCLSDHQVMHRLAHNGNWSAWSHWRLWERLEDLHRLADRKRLSGGRLPGIRPTSAPCRSLR